MKVERSDAHDGRCPDCGHVFTLADLKRMAVGDGWERWIMARLPDGREMPVRFDDFDPVRMASDRPKVQATGTEDDAGVRFEL